MFSSKAYLWQTPFGSRGTARMPVHNLLYIAEAAHVTYWGLALWFVVSVLCTLLCVGGRPPLVMGSNPSQLKR